MNENYDLDLIREWVTEWFDRHGLEVLAGITGVVFLIVLATN